MTNSIGQKRTGIRTLWLATKRLVRPDALLWTIGVGAVAFWIFVLHAATPPIGWIVAAVAGVLLWKPAGRKLSQWADTEAAREAAEKRARRPAVTIAPPVPDAGPVQQ